MTLRGSVVMKRIIIGVMGPGVGATSADIARSEELGALIAAEGWVTLSGGRNTGVMEAVSRGAQSAGGLTIGVLPSRETEKTSAFVDLPIVTDMGSARNYINVLSSDIVIACGMNAGTASEVALALGCDKQVLLLGCSSTAVAFFRELSAERISIVESPFQAIERCRELLTQARSLRQLEVSH